MTELLDHAAYIAAAPEALRPQLAVVRDRLKQAPPDAEEVMQYGMPGFTSGGVMIAGYGAFSKQCGLYVSKGAIKAHADDIAAASLKHPRLVSPSHQQNRYLTNSSRRSLWRRAKTRRSDRQCPLRQRYDPLVAGW
ncbi:iron chaperone [Georhizobium sp. MAB10]|uniref:iron chaperone n=1 Tax=Georhizobium sp. MAB10 TaxID=3028319 RepID=UPI0038559AC8